MTIHGKPTNKRIHFQFSSDDLLSIAMRVCARICMQIQKTLNCKYRATYLACSVRWLFRIRHHSTQSIRKRLHRFSVAPLSVMFHHRRLIGHSFITNAKAAEWHFRKRAPFRMKIKYVFVVFFHRHNHTLTHTHSEYNVYSPIWAILLFRIWNSRNLFIQHAKNSSNCRKKNTKNILLHLHCSIMLLVEHGRNRTKKNCCSPICIIIIFFSHKRKRLMYYWLRPRQSNTK